MIYADWDSFFVLLWFLVGVVLYFVPAAIAASRKHRNGGAIMALNLFLGWSCLGWVGALVWALTDNTHERDSH